MEWISENYNLIITENAQNDIDGYVDTIINSYDAPKTAKKHYDALYEVFRKIKKYPTANPIRYNTYLSQYGYNVRRVNFKKMAIIYTINKNTIYIHRVIPSGLIF